jgi:peptidyl-prolyl cis-trans isomerase C
MNTKKFHFSISPAIAGLFILATFLFGCTNDFQKISGQPTVKVGEALLSTKEFSDQLARKLKNLDALAAKDPSNINRAKDDIVREFIIKCLIEKWSTENKLNVSDTDLDQEVNKLRSSYPDDLSFRRSLASENLSFSDWRENLRTIVLQKVFFKKISEKIPTPQDSEIVSYYNQNKNLFKRKERILLRQIVVDAEAKGETIQLELKKKDFADLAKKFSVAPEAKNGGLVGWIEQGSVDIFEKAFSLPLNSIGPLLESSYGFHIFKVEKKIPAGFASIEDTREIIIQTLRGLKEQAAFANWLDKQLRSSRIFKNNDLINAIHVETRDKKK